ncbi:hypothetical protein GCM10011352_11750 [Marinobacterium zhoushanense]|uniref:Uncharacterized protein n=1 Tax=Marinobacterium zhoushanense TaxID=1679163 RepID=A0ABQ1K5Q3_9GAMM|nr:hypothetical protein [Marinobacterium zhoushanense]GGB87450.1 hypothetical protein GCM10011352_11750 [Marinobacterium zhoushanense]
MATSKEQWNLAYDLLSQFERELIDPALFKWDYFIENVGASKQTFMRNKEFNDEFKRVRNLVRQYKNSNASYSLERSLKSKKDQEIDQLKEQITHLEKELDRAREQLAYACLIARRNNIDPDLFMERSPLLRSNIKPKEDSKLEANQVVSRLRAVKKRPVSK